MFDNNVIGNFNISVVDLDPVFRGHPGLVYTKKKRIRDSGSDEN